jgi:hypothetical protein
VKRLPVHVALSFLLLGLGACVVRVAEAPRRAERHPAYLHAIQDMRHARAQLERPAATTAQTAWDENVAIRDLDAAIQEARAAASDDGKNVAALPPIDVAPDWSGRLHRALELMERARNDMNHEEDNPGARGAQQRSIGHVDQAIAFVRQGISANVVHAAPPPVAPPPPVAEVIPADRHPAYIHALEDLRHARGHLERPAAMTRLAQWDEEVAIRDIDAAIHEITRAAIDDGKNIADHPPVDARMDWRGRLHRADELLRKARQDCSREEDNPAAQGLQRRALQHIDAAIAFVEQGMRVNHW